MLVHLGIPFNTVDEGEDDDEEVVLEAARGTANWRIISKFLRIFSARRVDTLSLKLRKNWKALVFMDFLTLI